MTPFKVFLAVLWAHAVAIMACCIGISLALEHRKMERILDAVNTVYVAPDPK